MGITVLFCPFQVTLAPIGGLLDALIWMALMFSHLQVLLGCGLWGTGIIRCQTSRMSGLPLKLVVVPVPTCMAASTLSLINTGDNTFTPIVLTRISPMGGPHLSLTIYLRMKGLSLPLTTSLCMSMVAILFSGGSEGYPCVHASLA
jgi:hypothetical protein